MSDSEIQTAQQPRRLYLPRSGRTLILVLLLAAVATPLVAMRQHVRFGSDKATSAEPITETASALPVPVVRAGEVRPPHFERSYAGLLIAEKESELSFERQGRITRVEKQEGDVVQAGEQIAQLDVDDLNARAERTLAELAAAEALLRELVAGPRKQSIDAGRASVERLLAELELAKADMQREQQLANNGAGSQRALDAVSYGLRKIEEELKSARAELDLLEEGTRVEQIEAQRAVCDSIRGQLQEIEVSRRDSMILAPFDGRVRSRLVDEGAVIQVGTAVIHLISDRIEGRFGLPAEAASTLQQGDRVEVSVRGRRRPATVDRLEPTVDLATRTRAVYARLTDQGVTQGGSRKTDDPGETPWIPGQVASIHLPAERTAGDSNSDSGRSRFWVPTSALTSGGRGLWTLLVVPGEEETGICQRRAVEVLQTNAGFSQVQGMLTRGERVITDGLHRITAGMRVTVVASHGLRGIDTDPPDASQVSG